MKKLIARLKRSWHCMIHLHRPVDRWYLEKHTWMGCECRVCFWEDTELRDRIEKLYTVRETPKGSSYEKS